MGQPDPNVNFRVPKAMRDVAELMVRKDEYGDLSDLMRRTLQDRLYCFVGKTLVQAMTWDGVFRVIHDYSVIPRVQIPVPVKTSTKG